MTWVRKLHLGRVIYAARPDQRGENPKRRPWVLLHDASALPPDSELVVVAVTTTYDDPLPDDHVLLPYSNDRRRRAVTGLSAPTAAHCGWLDRLPIDSIVEDDLGGVIPPAVLAELLEKVRAVHPSAIPGPPPPP